VAAAAKCTNEWPPGAPSPALSAWLGRLLDGSGPTGAEEWDLVEAIRAARLPGAAPYRGGIDRSHLALLLTEHRFDGAGLAWPAALEPPGPQPERAAPMAPR
jgi:hypothetical protein